MGGLQPNIQTTVSGTDHTVPTKTEKRFDERLSRDQLFFRAKRETTKEPQIGDTIIPKNRRCPCGSYEMYFQRIASFWGSSETYTQIYPNPE